MELNPNSTYLAVYGLLRPACGSLDYLGVAAGLKHITECKIKGRLFNLGRFPGLIPGDSTVTGDLLEVTDERVWATLDGWEDYYPDDLANSRYQRLKVNLIAPEVKAYVYIYLKAGEPIYKEIPSGDWMDIFPLL